MSRTTRLGGVVVLLGLVAGVARADGCVTLCGDRATVVGRLGAHGVVAVNEALGFVLRKEGLGLVPPGSWVKATGRVLPCARGEGRRALLCLESESLEVLEVTEDVTRTLVPPTPGILGALGGATDDAELERLYALAREERDPAVIDDLAQRIRGASPAVRRRWASRLAELGVQLPREADLVDGLRAAVASALQDGELTRAEWDACRSAWRRVQAEPEARERARWLAGGTPAEQAIHSGLRAELPFEVVADLLHQVHTPCLLAVGGRDASCAMALPCPGAAVLGTMDAGTAAGRACNALFEELKDRLDELKSAVRARVRALNAQDRLSREQVEELYDLRQAAAATAAFGAVDAVLTEEGGKAGKAWQASRCTGGRERVYVNYQALGGS